MTLDEFTHSRRCMDWTAEEAREWVETYDYLEDTPNGPQLVGFMVYQNDYYIAILSDGTFDTTIERDIYRDSDLSLIEAKLFKFYVGNDEDFRHARLDDLARAFMATRPDLKPMSLDKWFHEHAGSLDSNEYLAASAIINMY